MAVHRQMCSWPQVNTIVAVICDEIVSPGPTKRACPADTAASRPRECGSEAGSIMSC